MPKPVQYGRGAAKPQLGDSMRAETSAALGERPPARQDLGQHPPLGRQDERHVGGLRQGGLRSAGNRDELRAEAPGNGGVKRLTWLA